MSRVTDNRNYASHTTGSRNLIKRWLHQKRFETSLRLLAVRPKDRVLDYGCGNGELAHRIHQFFPDARITAFDPAQELLSQAEQRLAQDKNVQLVADLEQARGPFDRIACLETVEHLSAPELNTAFDSIDRLLATDGLCLFTFPIEHGLMGLIKNCYRIALRGDIYASPARTARAFLGWPVVRQPCQSLSGCRYIYSHVGFDCRQMLRDIATRFDIRRVHVLPAGTIAFGLGNGVGVVVGKKT